MLFLWVVEDNERAQEACGHFGCAVISGAATQCQELPRKNLNIFDVVLYYLQNTVFLQIIREYC